MTMHKELVGSVLQIPEYTCLDLCSLSIETLLQAVKKQSFS